MTLMPARPVATAALALALGLSLAACGSDDAAGTNPKASASSSYGPAATGAHNDADVAFATDMIPHHAQAVEMATMALEKATNDKVQELAAAIQSAQDPEIKTMSGWLVGWGKPVPTTEAQSSHGGGHSMGSSTSSHMGEGMMSEAQMAELDEATGAAFDKLWVEMMTEHHQGAITMARTELSSGQNEQAKALAQQIIDAQTSEIATMTELAKTLA